MTEASPETDPAPSLLSRSGVRLLLAFIMPTLVIGLVLLDSGVSSDGIAHVQCLGPRGSSLQVYVFGQVPLLLVLVFEMIRALRCTANASRRETPQRLADLSPGPALVSGVMVAQHPDGSRGQPDDDEGEPIGQELRWVQGTLEGSGSDFDLRLPSGELLAVHPGKNADLRVGTGTESDGETKQRLDDGEILVGLEVTVAGVLVERPESDPALELRGPLGRRLVISTRSPSAIERARGRNHWGLVAGLALAVAGIQGLLFYDYNRSLLLGTVREARVVQVQETVWGDSNQEKSLQVVAETTEPPVQRASAVLDVTKAGTRRFQPGDAVPVLVVDGAPARRAILRKPVIHSLEAFTLFVVLMAVFVVYDFGVGAVMRRHAPLGPPDSPRKARRSRQPKSSNEA